MSRRVLVLAALVLVVPLVQALRGHDFHLQLRIGRRLSLEVLPDPSLNVRWLAPSLRFQDW